MESALLDLNAIWEIPGDHDGMLLGAAGLLEARVMLPEQKQGKKIALLGHPHSLQGGSMQNKVVTTLARMFSSRGIPSVRFNFRGVGASAGVYDAGIGESEDMLVLAQHLKMLFPEADLLFAGFSFGSFVAYRAAAQMPHQLLLTVAPPVNHVNFEAFEVAPQPWLLVQGDSDEVIPSRLVFEFASKHAIRVLKFEDTGHFFHGRLTLLKTRILEALDEI